MGELVKINASDYGLEETKAEEIKKGLKSILAERDILSEEYDKCVVMEIVPANISIFKDLRLRIRDNRTKGIEVWHKNNKAYFLAGGNFVDAIKRKEVAENERMEEKLLDAEKFLENQERERLEKLRSDRLEQLKPYTEIEPLALGHMEQTVFDNLLAGFKVAYEVRIAAEKKAEDDRIAREKAEADAREAQRLENIRLQKEAEEREKLMIAERKKAEAEKQRLLKKQEEERETARKEQEKKDRIIAEQNAKAIQEKKEAEERERKLREEKERIEREAKDKETARLKAIEDEKKARAKAEQAAKLAPDKTKLLAFGQAINDLPRPEIKTIEAAAVMAQINGLLVKLNNYIVTEANKL